jgi:GPH family glycoside/pentoside/hexuronide:cation symporter
MRKILNQTPGQMNFAFKTLWGVGNFGASILGGIIASYQLIYYQNYLGMDKNLYALAILLFTIWNAFNDPVMGYISDNTKSKHGRRVPYFRWSIPFVVFSGVMVFMVPLNANPMVLFWWLFVTLFIYDLAFTMFYMMYGALWAEVTEHENERASLSLSYQLLAFFGSVIGLVLPSLINPDFANPASVTNFRYIIIVIGVIGGIMMAATAFNVKERKLLYTEKTDKPHIFRDLWTVFKIKPFRHVVGMSFINRGAQGIITAMLYYIAFFVYNMDALVFTLAVMLPMGLGMPVILLLQRKFGAYKVSKISFLVGGVALLIGAWLPMIVGMVFFAFAGISIAGLNINVGILFCDVIDYEEVRTGERKEGMLLGASAFIMVFSFLFTAAIPYVLDFTGFITADQNGGVDLLNQPLSAVNGIRGIISAVGILFFVGYFLLKIYPLRGDYLAEMKNKLLQIHSDKEGLQESQSI